MAAAGLDRGTHHHGGCAGIVDCGACPARERAAKMNALSSAPRQRENGAAAGPLPDAAAPAAKQRASGALPPKVKILVRNLSFYYGETLALKNINVALYANKVTAFIGPSGCGKSTLLRVLNRMYDLYPNQRAEGEVILEGENILRSGQDVNLLRARVGMVFQKPTPFPMSIRDNVAFAVGLYEKLPKAVLAERVEEALVQAALWDEVKEKLGAPGLSLSGGQQQRLCIARAVALRPDVILLDEPCSALDPISTAKIEETIDELKENYTIAIVTHNMQQAARVSDHTAFMYLGEIVEFGATTQIFTAPEKERTQNYITGRFG